MTAPSSRKSDAFKAGTIVDYYLPKYEFHESHQIEILASTDHVYDALFTTDLSSPAIVRALSRLRSIPSAGVFRPPRSREPLTLANPGRAGFILLSANPPWEVVLGIQGKFWGLRPDVRCVDEGTFTAALPPNTARAVWSFFVEERGPRKCVLRTETRVHCADAASRRKFRLYWLLIRPGSGMIRKAILRTVKRAAMRVG